MWRILEESHGFHEEGGRGKSSLTEYKREDLVKIVSDTWPRTFLEYNVRPQSFTNFVFDKFYCLETEMSPCKAIQVRILRMFAERLSVKGQSSRDNLEK